jgi:hypothetical protein
LVCGLVTKFLASSAWQVAHVSAPTNSACAAGVAGAAVVAGAAAVGGAVWALASGSPAGNAAAQSMQAASRNLKDARSPGCSSGATRLNNLGNLVTGLSVCIENPAFEEPHGIA